MNKSQQKSSAKIIAINSLVKGEEKRKDSLEILFLVREEFQEILNILDQDFEERAVTS